MPVNVDLAQFPRLVCRRCGLVALIDPALPLDVHPALTCPNCMRALTPPRVRIQVERLPREEPIRPPARRAPRRRPPSGPLPSNAVVGLTLAGIVLTVLVVIFVIGMITPHTNYWNALTR